MLLPSGRWNSHCRVVDVKWLMLLPLGRCYSPGSIIYFNLSSGMLNRTLSHICGRWYLSTFLFRDGLLTLKLRASFIALLRLWSSLPTMLKFSIHSVTSGVKMVKYGGGGLLVFLEPLCKGP